MSVNQVKSRINTARADGKVTVKEARDIVKAAEKTATGGADKVTNLEGKKVGEFFEKKSIQGSPPPGATWNPPKPGSPMNPDLTAAARKEFNQFFLRNKLPYGENGENMKTRMAASIEHQSLGDKLDHKPNVANLHEVFLHDQRPVDGDRQVAFLDAEKGRFYVRADGGGRANGQAERWYGPLALEVPMHPLNPPRPR